MKKGLLIITVLLVGLVSVGAQDSKGHRDVILFENNGFIFTSYMRVGAHVNTDGDMVEGGGKWNVEDGYNGMRFMNEANYNEWLLGYESSREETSWWGGAYFRVAFDIPDFSTGWLNISGDNIVLPEAYFRLGYSDKDWNLWMGRRYNDKIAIGMMDYYIANLDGNGGGIEGIALGEATMEVDWLFSYNNGKPNAEADDDIDELFTYPGKHSLAFIINGVPVGEHAMSFIVVPSIQTGGTVASSADSDGIVDGTTSYDAGAGGFLAIKYNRDCFFGMDGSSETFVSVGLGSGANQHVDTALGVEDWWKWSALAGFQGTALATDTFSFKSTLYYDHRSYESMTDFLSFGFRPMFRLARIFALQFEYDLEAAIEGGKMVNRFTFAPTFLPPEGNVDSQVQVMPYITYAYGDFSGGDAVTITGDHGMTFGLFGHVGF